MTQANLTRAFAAMFLSDPHTVARSYKSIRSKIGGDIFGKSHRLEPYYTAAVTLYKLGIPIPQPQGRFEVQTSALPPVVRGKGY